MKTLACDFLNTQKTYQQQLIAMLCCYVVMLQAHLIFVLDMVTVAVRRRNKSVSVTKLSNSKLAQ